MDGISSVSLPVDLRCPALMRDVLASDQVSCPTYIAAVGTRYKRVLTVERHRSPASFPHTRAAALVKAALLGIASEAEEDAVDAHFTARAWMQHANLLSSAATQFP